MPASNTSILEGIVARPAMYWGDSANHFHSFLAFLSGYDTAMVAAQGVDAWFRMEKRDPFIPPDFHEFVKQHFGSTSGSDGWTSLIQENTKTDREALELFLQLRRQCLAGRPA